MAESEMKVDLGGGLAAYLAAADETTAEHLASDGRLIAVLWEYDEYFRNRLWLRTGTEPISLVLFMNAYQMFLAGVRTALSGHTAAVFPLLRTAPESAAYGGLIAAKPELSSIWTDRHQNDEAKKACRATFTFDKAIKPLKERAPDIYELAVLGYNSAIDFGAHPNVKGVFGHVTLDEDRTDTLVLLNHTSLYGVGHIEAVRGLCACLDFGLAIIGTIALALPVPLDEVAVGLSALSESKNEATAPYSSPDPDEDLA
jgi:hypothetical protein